MSIAKIVLIILAFVSVFFLFMAIHIFKVMQKCYVKTQAVVDHIAITGDGNYSPVFKYQTENETITKKHMISTRPMNKFHEGDIVDLYYNPKKPTQYILDNGSPYKFLVIILMAAAITILILAIVFYLVLPK